MLNSRPDPCREGGHRVSCPVSQKRFSDAHLEQKVRASRARQSGLQAAVALAPLGLQSLKAISLKAQVM